MTYEVADWVDKINFDTYSGKHKMIIPSTLMYMPVLRLTCAVTGAFWYVWYHGKAAHVALIFFTKRAFRSCEGTNIACCIFWLAITLVRGFGRSRRKKQDCFLWQNNWFPYFSHFLCLITGADWKVEHCGVDTYNQPVVALIRRPFIAFNRVSCILYPLENYDKEWNSTIFQQTSRHAGGKQPLELGPTEGRWEFAPSDVKQVGWPPELVLLLTCDMIYRYVNTIHFAYWGKLESYRSVPLAVFPNMKQVLSECRCCDGWN